MAKQSAIMLRDCKNRTLLIKNNGKWSVPSSECLEGESLKDCAIRALFETTGISIFADKNLLVQDNNIKKLSTERTYKLFVYEAPCEFYQRLQPCINDCKKEIHYKWVDSAAMDNDELDFVINKSIFKKLLVG